MRSALFQFFTIKAMTIENIENHMAYTCKCGGVNFALLKSGAIECNKCNTALDDVKWWAGGMGAQLARAIKAEDERDALKAARPVGDMTYLANGTRFKIVRDNPFDCKLYGLPKELSGRWVALVPAEDDCHLAARSQPVLEPLTSEQLEQEFCELVGLETGINSAAVDTKRALVWFKKGYLHGITQGGKV